MDEIRILVPNGMLGEGYPESSLEEGLKRMPHFIGSDAGSTDGGPDGLGGGICHFPRAGVKRDLKLMLLGAKRLGIPLIVGSAGTAGGDINLQWVRDIIEEIASENNLHFTLAVIHSEQTKEYIRKKLAEGKIKPLGLVPQLTEDVIDRSAHIVGMMGVEPFIKALEEGAEVILAGRSSDTSIFSAIPIKKGVPPGIVWHCAKVIECGSSAASSTDPDSIMAIVRRDHFIVEPTNPKVVCTPQSVAAHCLYENADPYHLYEPSGMLDTSEATYEAQSDRAVRVSGSKFIPADRYTVKIEGAELVGYQSIVIGGIRDPIVIAQVDSWLQTVRRCSQEGVRSMVGEVDYQLGFRLYGKNGVMGRLEPVAEPAHELCLIIEATANNQDLADLVAKHVSHVALHNPVPEWEGSISFLAFPYAPKCIQRGKVYSFNMNHLVEPDTPYEMFPMEKVSV